MRALVIALWGATAAASFAAAPPPAHADSTVLEYDSSGRVQGTRHTTVEGEGLGPAGRGAAVGADLPPGAVHEPGHGASDPDQWYREGEVVVANPPEGFGETVAGLGFSVIERLSLRSLSLVVWRLKTPEALPAPEAVRILRRRFTGTVVDLAHVYEASGQAGAALSRARAAIGWPDPAPDCGAGIRIGMIDTAVDVTHPALDGQKITYRSFLQPSRKPSPADHGTGIAAMLVGKPDPQGWGGLLPAAELFAANIFGEGDYGGVVADVMALLRAVEWQAELEVGVINLSIAGAENRILRYALDRARERGLVLVAAAGNWGRADKPAYPAAYRDVLAITAVDSGYAVYSYANKGPYIDFAAPGVAIWTAAAGGGGHLQSGTSFAVPYLTSVIAAEIAAGRRPSPALLRDSLRREALDLGPAGRDDTFGWGLVRHEPACRIESAKRP